MPRAKRPEHAFDLADLAEHVNARAINDSVGWRRSGRRLRGSEMRRHVAARRTCAPR